MLITQNRKYGIFATLLLLMVVAPLPGNAAPPPPADSIAPVLEKVLPAVVNISTSKVVGLKQRQLLLDPYSHQPYAYRDRPIQKKSQSLGSGVIVDAKKGWVITNHHVVDGADEITVTLRDQRSFKAKLLGEDPGVDIALLQIDADKLTALPLSNSEYLRVGDFVVAIGNPFGLGQTVTYGIVSALGRTGLGIEGYEDFIQTDASINPGNSGGALVTTRGKLVGINTAIMGGSGNIGIGFAIPATMVKAIVSQLAQYGEVQRGQLGVVMQDMTRELADAFGISHHHGAVVTQVLPGSAADKAGLISGDIIIAIDGKDVSDGGALRNAVGMLRAGSTIKLKVIRDGKRKNISAKIALPKDARAEGFKFSKRLDGALLGNLDDKHPLSESGGVEVLKVKRNSPAWEAGLRAGDVIVSVNRQPVGSLMEFSALAAQAGDKGLLLNIVWGNGALFVVIR
ncbi:Do family serine endopeptidase [Thiolapillus sp.]|uniref:Do family serine endopeptidase n=3 Tax=Thiolapillus sp. TaxID=2017437 RepID=UPI0025D3FB55|nr:Do family serine endopeptidase [Thiolapillus sp.]